MEKPSKSSYAPMPTDLRIAKALEGIYAATKWIAFLIWWLTVCVLAK